MPTSQLIASSIRQTNQLLSEVQLIKNCQQYKKKSQFELVKRYSAMLMAVSRRYVHDESIAKDILQESFIRIFTNIDNYQPTGSFEAWMRKITIRCALYWLKKNNFQNEMVTVDELENKTTAPEVFSLFRQEEIFNMIQELPLGFRTVFNLVVIEGFSHKEVAELLNISESTSRSQLARARKILQNIITSLQY